MCDSENMSKWSKLFSVDISYAVHPIDHICLFLNRSTYLYDILRPKLIHEANIDLLCELVHILKVEVLGDQSARQSEPLAGLRPTLQRVLADVNERLTFRARTYIRDEVSYLSFPTSSLPCLYFHMCGLLICDYVETVNFVCCHH